jgi:hypothetical protein
VRDASDWTFAGGQAGSTPGGLFNDERGQRWYVKTPPSDDHADNEIVANRLYRLAGSRVPQLERVGFRGRVAVASARVDGITLGDALALPASRAAAELCLDFAVDAWLANRDVLGAELDNVIVGRDGAVVRIDQGGALNYRAQGAVKTDFGSRVIEFDTMRDPRRNAVAAGIFGAMTPFALAASVAKLARIEPVSIAQAIAGVLGQGRASRDLIDLLIARRADLIGRTSRRDAGLDRSNLMED